ncbi:MAG TPA: glycosyltransferase family 2 protein [Steroidobacteraceae bacterium]|nr:glycosyltransferase family 2 protein [Steroidobacteraceae bacterium]
MNGEDRRPWSLIAPLIVYALLVAWIALSAADVEADVVWVLLYGLANLIVFTDALDFGLRLYVHRRHTAVAAHLGRDDMRGLSIDLPPEAGDAAHTLGPRPYAIIASIFNLEEHVDEFMERLRPFRDHVWLISDGSTDDTARRLRLAGWRCLEEDVNRKKPAALQRLLATLPARIETVMVIDPDVRICGRHEGSTADLERVIADLQRSGAAAVSPRMAIERDGFLARFQAFEYLLCCEVGRRSLADFGVTSGAAIYRRDALEHALGQHSLSVYAEDLENAVILLREGERIYYDGRLVVSAQGPGAFRQWFSQRVGWYYGFLRVYARHFGDLWRIGRRSPFAMYNFVAYLGVLGLGLHVLRVASAVLLTVSALVNLDNLFALAPLANGAVINPVYFVAAVGSYLTLSAVALFTVVPRGERSYIAPIVPLYFLYVLVHIVPITIGLGNWVTLRLWGRRLYRDHYESSDLAVARRMGGRASGTAVLPVRAASR